MTQVTIHEAKTHLSRLIQEALAGNEIIIAKGKTPVVRLEPIYQEQPERQLGQQRGLVIHMSDDFDTPLDDFTEYMK